MKVFTASSRLTGRPAVPALAVAPLDGQGEPSKKTRLALSTANVLPSGQEASSLAPGSVVNSIPSVNRNPTVTGWTTPSSFTCTLPDTKDTVAAGVVERGGFTTRTNVVILFSGLPLTRIEKVPVGVDSVVLMVSSILQVGWHPFRLNDGVAPAGNPEAESETFSVV